MRTNAIAGLAAFLATALICSADLAVAATTTTLAQAASPGDTNIKVASVTGFAVGSVTQIDAGANLETVTLTSVGSATRTTTLAAAVAAGSTNVKVTSVTGLVASDTVNIGTGASLETRVIATVGTAGGAGTGVTLTSPLSTAHATGTSFNQPGTGLTFTPPIALSHPIGTTVTACPPTPTISATTNGTGTQDQACPEQPLTLTATSAGATAFQWYLDGTPISGETAATYTATGAGTYTVAATDCVAGSQSAGYVVQDPTPSPASVTPLGPTTFCQGGSVVLQSDSATGIQWYRDDIPIAGASSMNYTATATGTYYNILNALGCHSQQSNSIVVTVNPIPATPAITAGGPTTFCAGGSLTLTSSSASGNQWYLNGNPIGGATSNTYDATASGSYTVIVTANGCDSAPSAASMVTINPNPDATITAPPTVTAGTSDTASVSDGGAGATYNWSITGGSIDSGAGSSSVGFTAGGAGTMTLQVTVTTSAGCSDTKSRNVTVVAPIVTVTSVTPGTGPTSGGTAVTIQGSGFQNGATVTFGGVAATNVVVSSATLITATAPGHLPGTVSVTVTNPDMTTETLINAFVYAVASAIPTLDWRILALLTLTLVFIGARMQS